LVLGDGRGPASYISPAACERFGLAAEDIIGEPFTSLFETDPENPGERSDRPLQFLWARIPGFAMSPSGSCPIAARPARARHGGRFPASPSSS
jgi:hypothetical protein